MASPWQTIRQARYLVGNAAWDTSPSEKVIGAAFAKITAGVDDDQDLPERVPFALLNLGNQTADDDDPRYLRQEIILALVASVEQDPFGEASLIGGASTKSPRSAYSEGRGLAEIEGAVLDEVSLLTGADGAPVVISYGSSGGTQTFRGRSAVWRQYVLSCLCSRADEYPSPQNLVATGGAGQIALTWDLPAARFDLSSMILRYASGATAPATVTSGTDGGVSTLATSKTITSLGAGTYSIAIFAKYVDTNTGDPKYSEQTTGTTRLSVTVT